MNAHQTLAQAGTRAQGRVKIQVLDATNRIVEDRPWQKNLILDQGLDRVAQQAWQALFQYCAVGDGNTPTQVSSGGTTAAQSGTTVTASTGIFSAGTVGKLIRWGTGQEAKVTAYTNSTTVTVSPSQTVASGTFTIYNVDQVGLTSEIARNTSYLTGAGNCGTGISANVVTMKRTFDFDIETVNRNYAEVGFSWENVADTNLFSRVLIAGGSVSVPIGYQIRVIYELQITVTPSTSTAKTASISGWPVSPATNTNGTEQIQLIGLQTVHTDGTGLEGPEKNNCLEPSSNVDVIWISESSTAPLAFGTDDGDVRVCTQKQVDPSTVPYVNGTFYKDRQVTFPVGEANGTLWRSMGLGRLPEPDPVNAEFSIGFIFVFAQAQTKSNTYTLRLTFRVSWGRDLS